MAEGSSHWRAMLQPLFDSFVATQLHTIVAQVPTLASIFPLLLFTLFQKPLHSKCSFSCVRFRSCSRFAFLIHLILLLSFFHALEIIPFNITQHRHTKKRSPCHSALTDSFPFDDNNGNDDDDKARVSMLQNLFNQNRLK